MSREIKFRAWGPPEGMIYSEHKADKVGCFKNTNFFYDIESNPTMIIDVMQYTGLNDKNGKEIYEGDILSLKYFLSSGNEDNDDYKTIQVVITFQSGGFWFTGEGFTDCNWHFYNESDREVIGNIYETPELVK